MMRSPGINSDQVKEDGLMGISKTWYITRCEGKEEAV